MSATPGAAPAGPGGVGSAFLKLGGGEVAARIIAFVATVYLARTLGASTYGVIILATAVLLYLNVLTDCGVDMLGVQQVAANRANLGVMLPDILGARLLVGLLLAAVAVTAGIFLLPQPEGAVLAAYAMTLLAVGLGTRWVHLGLEQAGRAALARVLVESIAAVAIVATVRGPEDIGRVPVAQVAGEFVGALFLLRLLPGGLRHLRVRLRPLMVGALLGRSWPMVVHALLGLAIFNSDFLFLRWLRDSASVGMYAAAYTLISFFLNLATAYTVSLIPALTRLRGAPGEARGVFDTSMAQITAGALPICVGGILVARPILELVFGAEYLGATGSLQVLLCLLPLAAVRHVAQAGLLAHGRQDQLLRTVAWAAGSNLVLNLALIPRWGMVGAAWATVITEGLRAVMAVGYTARLGLPMTPARRFLPVVAAAAGMGAAVLLVASGRLWVSLLLGAVTYGLILTALGGLRFRRNHLPELTV